MKYLHFAIFAFIVIFAGDIAEILPMVGHYPSPLYDLMLWTRTIGIIVVAFIGYKKFVKD